ncbi:TrmB family transcriptional regulator [Methanocella sp. CWC-04]|uniref:TrmB family transcriptional regulator n=1 Tax=Methanooceanicella nereidis TaxID=2052831 RepID=A0AAP2REP4_9EURY|nr:helix-turn-helix domain-containing protein [Methanocella sp. CWC-04]MCD1294685.1 TrmB family transcriptional regulator [Methanocella sp. CWC-04]
MNNLSTSLIESLKTLGLTEYEAKVYSALVLFDRTEVKQVYEYLDAPKPSVYQSLKTLMDKGLVQVVNVKPAIYRATPPKIALKHMMEIHKNAEETALEELEELERMSVQTETPDVLWTLYGDESIEHSIEELFTKANMSVKAILPDTHLHYLELLRDKDIPADVIVFREDMTIPEKYGLKHAKVYNAVDIDLTDLAPFAKYISNLPIPMENYKKFLMILIDSEEFIYIPPMPATVRSGITSRNPFIIGLISLVFQALLDRTPIIYPK